MEEVIIQQMLVLIDKLNFALPLEGQMNYWQERVQGQMFLMVHSPSNQMRISSNN